MTLTPQLAQQCLNELDSAIDALLRDILKEEGVSDGLMERAVEFARGDAEPHSPVGRMLSSVRALREAIASGGGRRGKGCGEVSVAAK